MIYECKHPVFSSPNQATIDLEYNHPEYGWIPFTATPDDVEELGRDIYAAAKRGDFGAIAPYTPPPPAPAPVPAQVTRRQGRLALLEAGKLDAVEAAIDAIEDPAQKRAAEIEYEADTWERGNAFLQTMWAQLGGTEEELDNLFILAASK